VRQLYATLLVEQILLLVSGITLGAALGVGLARLALTNLPFGLGTVAARPPFEPQIDWPAIILSVAALAVVLGAVLLFATLALWRTDLHRVLRIGEE
jgi:hypothetical protein